VRESLFNQVATDLALAMRDWWMPDETFLSGLRRDQLLSIANDVGAAARISGLGGWSKAELV
jgi:ParB family transcriptional regulator, chromosome partitioning protein